jgi:diguanylate cyclase (GGDEF)-like protein
MNVDSLLRIVTLVPLDAEVSDALARSEFGPFKVDISSSLAEAERLEGSIDAMLLAGDQFDAWLQSQRSAFDAAVLVVADHATLAQTSQWLQSGAHEVLTRAECSAAVLPRRIRMAIERQRLDRAARRAYATDLGTGLPHQQQLIEHMSHLLALREREPSPMALLVLRLEGLASTEARLGREAANVLRRKVAVRLRAGVRASDVVASLGEDSFSVLLAAMLAPSDAPRVGAKLLAALKAPFQITGHDVAVAASLGIAQYPQDGKQPQALLNRALGLAASAAAQGRTGFANFSESGGSAPAAANDD